MRWALAPCCPAWRSHSQRDGEDCNAADRLPQGCAGREGLVQRCPNGRFQACSRGGAPCCGTCCDALLTPISAAEATRRNAAGGPKRGSASCWVSAPRWRSGVVDCWNWHSWGARVQGVKCHHLAHERPISVLSASQVPTDANFNAIRLGMPANEVFFMIGRPAMQCVEWQLRVLWFHRYVSLS